jgi:hypothetical protein
MGQEAVCVGRLGDQVGEGKAMLETDYVLFRGPFRSKIPLSEIQKVKAESGQLWLTSKGGTLVLELGSAAQKWADKILHPPQRIDKLGIKPGMQVILLGVLDKTFHEEVASRTPAIATKPQKGADIVFVATEKKADLRKLAAARSAIKPNGSIWVVYPKGVQEITEDDVLDAGKAADLVDVKVARFSSTHTALKFVIPVAQR